MRQAAKRLNRIADTTFTICTNQTFTFQVYSLWVIPSCWASHPPMMSPTTEKRSWTWKEGEKPPPDHQQDQDHSELKKVQKDWTGYHLKHQVSSDLSWSVNATHLVKKDHQRPRFLRKLKQTGLSRSLTFTGPLNASRDSAWQRGPAVAQHSMRMTEPRW